MSKSFPSDISEGLFLSGPGPTHHHPLPVSYMADTIRSHFRSALLARSGGPLCSQGYLAHHATERGSCTGSTRQEKDCQPSREDICSKARARLEEGSRTLADEQPGSNRRPSSRCVCRCRGEHGERTAP